jgi:hypothetical protein
MIRRPLVPSLDEVPRDIDALYIRAEFRLWHRRGAITTPEI